MPTVPATPYYQQSTPPYADGNNKTSARTPGGGTDITWSAPSGLADTNQITLTNNIGNFEVPDKQFFIGCGIGWLNDNALDSTMQALTIDQSADILNGMAGVYEYADKSNRTIKQVDGVRVIQSFIHPVGGGGFDSAGNITVDTGLVLSPGDCMYMYSQFKNSIGVGFSGSEDSESQTKTFRFRSDPMSVSVPDNGMYLAHWNYGNGGSGPDTIQGKTVIDNGGTKANVRDAAYNNTWTANSWMWKTNTPDIADGATRFISMVEGETGITEEYVDTGDVASNIKSDDPRRPRYFIDQHYVGSRNGATTPYDFTINQTDFYCKLNGYSFELCDNVDPALMTELPVPLVVLSSSASNNVTLSLWKGRMASYAGKCIQIRDKEHVLVATVELV